MSNNIRIRTTPNGTDKYLNMKLEQDFDFIEILSLNISQDKVYETFCSDYGVIVGRVSINNGFGIPNAKVSVFIPVDDVDKNNPNIFGLYPYETVNDVDSNGIRYNLLPKESDSQNDCYTPIGTFPSKREILDNDEMLQVYCKYYKFTSQTNHAGDFMIFGVPLGSHTVHVDADISNIGIMSQKPYDLIEQGTPAKMFYSATKFKASKNLNSLIQVKSANIGVNVKPFWGDIDNCVIGINRLDIDLNYNARPTAIFMGSLFGDSRKNSVNKRCRPRKGLGLMCEQISREGTIEMLRKTIDGQVERFDVEGGRVIDENGAWAYQIPMNLDYVVTGEDGTLIPSDSTDMGIPTRARVRFRISMDEGEGSGRLRTRGKYIIPHNPNTKNEIDFSFDKSTVDNKNTFRDFYWNKIYTVRSFISRTEKNVLSLSSPYKIKAYTGIKDVDGCVGDKSPMPYNRTSVKGNVLFTIICFIFAVLTSIVAAVNSIICFIAYISFFGLKPFEGLANLAIKLKCPDDSDKSFKPGCGDDTIDMYLDCVKAALVDELNLFQFDFYNDWINGTLYYYQLKYKKTRRGSEKFCETYCNDYDGGTGYNNCKDSKLRDTTYNRRTDLASETFINGLLVKYKNELYYPPILLNGKNFKMFPTDITNLGSINECDWQGLPKIIQYLTDTSYKIPPLQAESYMEENTTVAFSDQTIVPGMFKSEYGSGLFFSVSCVSGVEFEDLNAKNIRRQCEINVDSPEYNGVPVPNPPYIGINEIYNTNDTIDTLTSINRYVRDSFYLLNTLGSGIASVPTVPYNLLLASDGTSFNITESHDTNGKAYDEFRGWITPLNNYDISFQTKNSFYMYFGIIPGKTALDKLNSKFFISCINETATGTTNEIINTTNEFIIDTTSIPVSINGATDGSILFTFIGGKHPFTYTWIGIDVSYTNITTTTTNVPPSGSITGLAFGKYQITASDNLGTIVIKEVTVGAPIGLSCAFSVLQQPSTQTSIDSIVEIVKIDGGTLPYTLEIFDINNSLVSTYTYQTQPINQQLTGLVVGTYKFLSTDSLGQTCISTVNIIGPQSLTITNIVKSNSCRSCKGSFSFNVGGGTYPYTVTTYNTSTNGNTLISDNATSFTNLCPSVYKIVVQDSGQPQPQSIETTITITGGLTINITNNSMFDFQTREQLVEFNVTSGVPDYFVTINDIEYTYIDSIIDTNAPENIIYRYQYIGTLPIRIVATDNAGCEKIVKL